MWLDRIGIPRAGIEEAFNRGHYKSGDDINKSYIAYGKNIINLMMNRRLKRSDDHPSFILMIHYIINNSERDGKTK
jgi:hypothetical protein